VPSGAHTAPTQIGLVTLRENAGGKTVENAGDSSGGTMLLQNTGKRAAVLSKIIQTQGEFGESMFRLRQSEASRWKSLVVDIRQVVTVMPLWKLQTVGCEQLEFLYDNLGRGSTISLKPGVWHFASEPSTDCCAISSKVRGFGSSRSST